jgi:DNA-binding transcriptional MerR regulator
MPLDIAALSKKTGLPASALRFYEEKGLIESIGRKGMRRVFDDDIVERLSLIALGRQAGFSLDDIRAMFRPDGSPDIDRGRLKAKADELDRKIRDLTALRDGLRHAADCPAPSHLECPVFRRLVRRAGTTRALGRTIPSFGRPGF